MKSTATHKSWHTSQTSFWPVPLASSNVELEPCAVPLKAVHQHRPASSPDAAYYPWKLLQQLPLRQLKDLYLHALLLLVQMTPGGRAEQL